MSGISEDLFAMKLYEMEQQYGKLQGRLRVCCRERREELQEELKKAKAEYEVNALLLRKSVEGSRSPAVKKLAQAQWSYLDTMARLTRRLLEHQGCQVEDGQERAVLHCLLSMGLTNLVGALRCGDQQTMFREQLQTQLTILRRGLRPAN